MTDNKLVRMEDIKTVDQYISSGLMTRQLKQSMASDKLAQRMSRAIINATMMNPKLLKCSPASFVHAAMNSAVLNLAPGPAGLCAFVPRKSHGAKDKVQFQFMYR